MIIMVVVYSSLLNPQFLLLEELTHCEMIWIQIICLYWVISYLYQVTGLPHAPSVNDYSVSMLRCKLNLLCITRNHAYVNYYRNQYIAPYMMIWSVSVQSWNLAQKRKNLNMQNTSSDADNLVYLTK